MIDNTIKTQDQINIYTNEIYILVDEFINSELLQDNEILENPGFFPRLIQHINRSYITKLLNNNKCKNQNKYPDIQLLNELFFIYCDLVYKYKKSNKRPSIEEFCIFTSISKQTIYNWCNGKEQYIYNNINNNCGGEYINNNYIDVAKNWLLVCETALLDDPNIKSIFLLKAKYSYREEPTQIIVSNNQQVLTASSLPKLSDTKNHTKMIDMRSHNDIINVASDPLEL